MEPCSTCDVIGPDRDAATSACRDLHRALHDVYRAVADVLVPAFERMRLAAERERLATKDAYVLVNESVAAHLRGER